VLSDECGLLPGDAGRIVVHAANLTRCRQLKAGRRIMRFSWGADPVVSSAMSVLDEEMWLKKCGIGQQARIDRT
jgi:hypothetical protein